ncbi:MAG: RMD1 family protein [Rhodoplanes sp.]
MTDGLKTERANAVPAPKLRLTARGLLLGERIDTAGLERSDVISTTPLAFRIGAQGYAVLFRFGVAVLVGLSPVEEDDVVRGLAARIVGPFARIEDEAAVIEVAPDREEHIAPGGHIIVRELSAPRLLVIADALAKNVALARDEREVSKVIEVVEPFAAELARTGSSPSNRRQLLRTIGQALLVHHRMSGRVQVEEKPDILWDQPEFERLYARLEDEYELKERAAALARKLRVIDETARALTDIMDTTRSVRLEAAIVALIVVEVLVTFYQLFKGVLW